MKKLILILLFFLPFTLLSQMKIGSDLTIVHFNAGWNSANNVKWIYNLSDAKPIYHLVCKLLNHKYKAR